MKNNLKVILDTFCGTATTGCRSLDLGRSFVGIEGNPKDVKSGTKELNKYLISKQLF